MSKDFNAMVVNSGSAAEEGNSASEFTKVKRDVTATVKYFGGDRNAKLEPTIIGG